MHHLTLWQIDLWAWYAFMVAWGVAALKTKPDRVVEPRANRLLYGVYVVVGFALLFSRTLPVGLLRQRFVAPLETLQLAGVALTYAGAAIAIWARLSLGDNWSARIAVKVGHRLVCSGPYAYVRHPIYSGILLSVFGTALLIGEWRGLLAIPLVGAAFLMKGKREEAYMTTEFGEAYLRYRQTTGFLLPKVHVSHFTSSANESL